MRQSTISRVMVCLVLSLAGSLQLQNRGMADDSRSESATTGTFPRLVRFSGTLPERRGASPTSAASARVTFAIYEEQAGGAALWSEVQDVRHDAQGRYSVLLGAASSDGLPAELFSTAGARWLGVQAEGRSEEARILLVAVPYALKAADADTLGGKPATAFVASDQLKEQVQSEVKAQVTESTSTTRTLVGTSPTPQVIAETSPATFTCATSGICVQSTQSGAGGIALRAAVGSATGTAGIFDNLGGGKILSGRTTGYVEKFSVASNGNVVTSGSFAANAYAATSGPAISGIATAGSGATYGVRGQSASPSGVGAFGYATSPTGLTYGLLGSNLSASGTGLSGSASSLTGVTIGVRAVVQSPNGTAAIFDNLGGGKLISARTTGYAEKFSVAANGNVVTSGSVTTLGNLNLPQTTGAVGVIRMGGVPFIHGCCGVETGNTFVGQEAGNLTIGTGENTGVGYGALHSDTSGGSNTAIGVNALYNNTAGVQNTAVGNNALSANINGIYNTATGYRALTFNTTGNNNTATGTSALDSNISGSQNTAVGLQALTSNTTGSNNTAVGFQTMPNSADGSNNTAVGYAALAYNCLNVTSGCTGANNTAVGFGAGFTGNASNANKTGANNTFIGYNSGPGTSAQLSNATAIGANAFVSQSNALVLGGGGVKVGIGTAAPADKLQVVGGDIFVGSVFNAPYTGADVNAVYVLNDAGDARNTFRLDANGDTLYIGGYSAAPASAGTNIILSTGAAGTGEAGRLYIYATGNVEMTRDLTVDGCIAYNGGSVGACLSDRRLKTNIQNYPPVLTKLSRLQPVHFDWRAAEFPDQHFGTARNAGLIAQDVEAVFPEMVKTDSEGFKRVNYSELPYLLLEGVRELKAENDDLKRANTRKDEDIIRLTRQVQALRKAQTQMQAFEARLARLEKGTASGQTASAAPAAQAGESRPDPTMAKVRF